MQDNFLKDYEILDHIGLGGMGTVHKARCLKTQRIVAIKEILPQFLQNDAIRGRFKQEALILKTIRHKNIVEFIEDRDDENRLAIVMEYVEGKSLDKYIDEDRGKVPYTDALKIMEQILDALTEAHNNGIVHRDLTPKNILVKNDGSIKIIDFGVAKLIDTDENLVKTMTNHALGAPRYMAPEQVLGKKPTIETDIYAAGLVLYKLLTGIGPFDDKTNLLKLQKSIVNGEIVSPRVHYDFIPPYVEKLTLKALKNNPEDRFASSEEFKILLLDRTMEVRELSVDFRVNTSSACVLIGEEGFRGDRETLALIPFKEYRITAWAEGKTPLDYVRSFSQDKEVVELVLEDEKNENKNNTNLFYAVLILFFASLFVILLLVYMNLNLSDAIDKKNKDLEWYQKTYGS